MREPRGRWRERRLEESGRRMEEQLKDELGMREEEPGTSAAPNSVYCV